MLVVLRVDSDQTTSSVMSRGLVAHSEGVEVVTLEASRADFKTGTGTSVANKSSEEGGVEPPCSTTTAGVTSLEILEMMRTDLSEISRVLLEDTIWGMMLGDATMMMKHLSSTRMRLMSLHLRIYRKTKNC